MKTIIMIASLLSMFQCISAQTWTSYPSVEKVRRVSVMHNKAYVLTGSSLCVADTASVENLTTLSRQNGLTGTSVFDIRYSRKADRLAIVYTDGNIDILTADNKIIPIPDFANNVSSLSHYPTGIAVQEDSLYVQTTTSTLLVDLRKGLIVRSGDQSIELASLDEASGYSTSWVNLLNDNLDENHNWVANAACMKIANGRLITAQSSHLFYGVLGGTGYLSILDMEDQTWSQIRNQDVVKRSSTYQSDRYHFSNLLAVGIDEANPSRYYVTGDGTGIFEFTDDTLSNFYSAHSCPEGIQPIQNEYSRVSAVHGDADGNLWVVCSGFDEDMLRCRTASGQWIKMPIKGFTNYGAGFIEMLITQHNPYEFIWLTRNYRWDEFGGAVYYRHGTNSDTKDDQSVWFGSLVDQDGNLLNPQYLYATIEDLNGVIWLLTSIGPCIVDSQVDFFDYASDKETRNIGKIRRVKIPRNDGTNLADYLLNNIATVCGVVDAANTKWIGTADNGVYHVSADGLVELDHFTTENSPLFSNAIQAMEYDGTTGKLYIATSGGVCVYQTEAVDGAPDNDHIYCYPNPVRPEFSGNLMICNLKDQSNIRITDVTGHVIYKTKTYGGQTSWDLCNSAGDRVKPGVYYIYSFDEDGKEGGMTKVLVQ